MYAHDARTQRIACRHERHERRAELNARRLSLLPARKGVDDASTERSGVARATAQLCVTRRTRLHTGLRERAVGVCKV
jgi:hypothetical protein